MRQPMVAFPINPQRNVVFQTQQLGFPPLLCEPGPNRTLIHSRKSGLQIAQRCKGFFPAAISDAI